MSDLWRSFKIGDEVQVVEWPPELHRDRLHAETCEFYDWLIATKSILTINEIDERGLPWGRLKRIVDGVKQSEGVALNHGGLKLVNREPPAKHRQF